MKPFVPSRRTVTKATALGFAAAVAGARPALGANATATATAGVSVTQLSARAYDLAVPSAALGRTAPVRIILPTSYAALPDRTWPVLYLLHGAHDDYTSWTRETDIEAFTAGRNLIVAMPDGGPTGIPSTWRDGTDYEKFQLTEVPAVLGGGFRASGVRAVAGISTGGYGAMAHAARNPGAFTAAASYSGILDTSVPGIPAVVDAIVARENLDPRSLWGSPIADFWTWRDFNPRARAAGLQGTALYISGGSGFGQSPGGGDELLPRVLEGLLWPACRAFATLLQLRRIPATEHFYSGGEHSWAYWRQEFTASWPVLARGLGIPG
ncbi:alpha/beta hydrolase [Streptomyces sp. NPDC052236]|uniref:alpha/beta hydrolase n=1 Tax=Streptomyces sp. NPDC052236 TaxID=3365686 RepID=UPI0037D24722